MRIVFAGTAAFAVPALRATNARHEVLAVITQPDRLGHRGRPASRPVGDTAEALDIRVLQPERIRHPAVVSAILDLGADALVVAAYGQIIPAALLDGHRYGGVNVHASLLPRWRGASPVAHAILAGDTETGVAIIRMDSGLDTGPVYATRRMSIGRDDTTPAITEELAVTGAEELVGVLAALTGGTAVATPQPEGGVTMAPRLTREMGLVRWEEHTAAEIDRMIRALSPWPGARAPIAGTTDVALLRGRVVEGTSTERSPGNVLGVSDDGANIATANGVFQVAEVRPPARRPMLAADFFRGRR